MRFQDHSIKNELFSVSVDFNTNINSWQRCINSRFYTHDTFLWFIFVFRRHADGLPLLHRYDFHPFILNSGSFSGCSSARDQIISNCSFHFFCFCLLCDPHITVSPFLGFADLVWWSCHLQHAPPGIRQRLKVSNLSFLYRPQLLHTPRSTRPNVTWSAKEKASDCLFLICSGLSPAALTHSCWSRMLWDYLDIPAAFIIMKERFINELWVVFAHPIFS